MSEKIQFAPDGGGVTLQGRASAPEASAWLSWERSEVPATLFKLKSEQERWLHMETELGRKLREGMELESRVRWVELFRQAGQRRDSEEVTFDPSSTRK